MATINNPEFPYADVAADNSASPLGISDSTLARNTDNVMRSLMANTRISIDVLYANDMALNADITDQLTGVTANGWVTTVRIADGAVITAKLADGAVTTAKADVATQAEAEAGTINTKFVTPLRVKQSIDANAVDAIGAGAITRDKIANTAVNAEKALIATQTQAEAGTDTTTLMTPQRTAQAINELAPAPDTFQGVDYVTSTSNYTIPAGTTRIMIKAAGAGAGSSINDFRNGGDGGETTVTNSTLGVDIVAKGGLGDSAITLTRKANVVSGSRGGKILNQQGGASGKSVYASGRSFGYSYGTGGSGVLVIANVSSNSLPNAILSISVGDGGIGGTATGGGAGSKAPNGEQGWVEIWRWGA